ncbi:hypothetical protein [Haloechinothrix salitolerans]|uniref:Uncharacterized protein n=1 Tax=Haloechinothrix salitolerans TaxID=926830 RepID=A0ABW2C7U4_9PSEU
MSNPIGPTPRGEGDEHGAFRRAATRVYSKPQPNGWHRIFVQYPGSAPSPLCGVRSATEAGRVCRWFAARYHWVYDSAASGGDDR